MTIITIDIETVPDTTGKAVELFKADADKEKAEVKAPSNWKDPEKIAEYIATKHAEIDAGLHERVLKTSFDGSLGGIAVIGAAIDDEEPVAFYEDSTEPHKHEVAVLKAFFDYVKGAYNPSRNTRPVFVGHNLSAFDLRFMFQRAVVLGIKPPAILPFNVKPWDDTIFDTMTAWAGFGNRIGLDKLAKSLGLQGKTEGMDGSQVWPAVAAGKIAAVADYCKDDVRVTREVYKRLTFQQAA